VLDIPFFDFTSIPTFPEPDMLTLVVSGEGEYQR